MQAQLLSQVKRQQHHSNKQAEVLFPQENLKASSNKWRKKKKSYHDRGLAVLFISKRFEKRLFSLRSTRLTLSTWATPLAPNFILVVSTWYHSFELSKITGTVSDMRSISYKESMEQDFAAHLTSKRKPVHIVCYVHCD